jgi:RNA polymerase sigma-70 factor (ECF subfamily)
VVANLCIDRMRGSSRLTVVADVPEEAAAPEQLQRMAEQDLAKRVDAALKTLPERQRLALVLFHYEGLSQVEVGSVLNVSEDAVESLLARARRALKAMLQDEWMSLLPNEGGRG